jgi:hypothetical protein
MCILLHGHQDHVVFPELLFVDVLLLPTDCLNFMNLRDI